MPLSQITTKWALPKEATMGAVAAGGGGAAGKADTASFVGQM